MSKSTTDRTTKTVVLLIATMSAFLTPFTSSSVNIALPSIGTQLSLNAVAISWVATAYLLAAAVFLLPVFEQNLDAAPRGMQTSMQSPTCIIKAGRIHCQTNPHALWPFDQQIRLLCPGSQVGA